MADIIEFDPLHRLNKARRAYLEEVWAASNGGRLKPEDFLDEMVNLNGAVRSLIDLAHASR